MNWKTKSNIWLFISLLVFSVCVVLYINTEKPNTNRLYNQFQNNLNKKEKTHKAVHNQFTKDFLESNQINEWNLLSMYRNNGHPSFFVTHDDQLVFWTQNHLPFELSEVQYSTNNYANVGNGVYHILKSEIGGFIFYSFDLIKTNFAYENEYLSNEFVRGLYFPGQIVFANNQASDLLPVTNLSNEIVFYLSENIDQVEQNTSLQFLIYLIFVLGLVFLFTAAEHRITERAVRYGRFIYFAAIFTIFGSMLVFNDWNPFQTFHIFDPELYASSSLLNSLGTLIILILFYGLFLRALYRLNVNKISSSLKIRKLLGLTFYIFTLVLAYIGAYLFASLVVNSTISLEIDKLFLLETYSFVALALMSLILIYYILSVYWVSARLVDFKSNQLALIWFISSVLYFLFAVYKGEVFLVNALWPGLINGLILYLHRKQGFRPKFASIVLLIALAAGYSALSLREYNQLNELQKRALFAHQLVSDKDAATEVEFLMLEGKIRNAEWFEHLMDLADQGELQEEIHDLFDDCCGDPFWERYNLHFFLYNNEELVSPRLTAQGMSWTEIQRVIKENTIPSEFSENLFHVVNNFDRLSYIGRITFENYSLFIKMESKRIPEQIGFPRILINESALVIEELEAYSIGRYYNGELVMRFGAFNYPTEKNQLTKKWGDREGHFVADGMSHFVFSDKEKQSIVISSPLKSRLENITNFSYLFIFFGLVFFLFQLVFKNGVFEVGGISMSLKIQIIMISILVVSFIVFGVVAGGYVKNQYNSFTIDNIQERLYSVEIEVKQKLGDSEKIERLTMGSYLDYILKKFSIVFATDINLYDLDGKLLSTSQPRLYSKQITGSQMNPQAFHGLSNQKSSEFIHQESIGNLEYLSAYLPLKNNNGELLAYLNLQHFSKQNVYENQLSGFLVTIINLAVLFLVISVIATLFVSSWVTSPLRMIQQSISKIDLGKPNKPINYKGNDELGSLVKEYNNKLEELELKAMQLAKSERESAWREMAKQVAHEIKNPLTPMKLSLQHFQRSFDPSDPNAKQKIDRISASLVEQINTLTNIANEFSSFAKMPKPNEAVLNLVDLLHNVISIFETEAEGIAFIYEDEDLAIYADKDLMIRAFNNLIKNALQAIPEDRSPDITISVTREKEFATVKIKDNGVGIPEDKRQKIFVPNFTTKTTGAGLGLAMVRQIIENHNGEIWFESEENVGTSFFIRIPLKKE